MPYGVDPEPHAPRGGSKLKRKRPDRTLRSLSRRDSSLFETLALGVIYQSADGTITAANPAAQRILGMTLPQMKGVTAFDERWRVVREDGTAFPLQEQPAMVALRSGSEVRDVVLGVLNPLRKDYSWISVSAVPQVRAGGAAPREVCTCFSDITNRRRVQEALRASEALFSKTFQCGPLLMTIGETDMGRFLEVNENFERVSGFSRGEAIGKTWLELGWINQEDQERLRRELRDKGRVAGLELQFHKKGGETVWCLYFGEVVDARGTKNLFSVAEDITERKRAEEALRESEERYQRITEGLTDYLYTVQVNEGRAVATVHSQACEVVTGYTREEFAADTYLWYTMIVPEDRERVLRHVERILAGEKVPPLEHRITRRDGRVRWVLDTTILHVDEQGRLVSYDGVVNDITGRKEAEAALRHREQQLFEAQKVAHLGFYDFDVASGVWRSSDVLDEIFGIGAEFARDLAGWISIIHPEERQSMLEYFQVEVLGKLQNFDKEYRILRRADGRECWVHGRGVLQLDDGGRPVCLFGTIQDITENKRAERLHLELERRLLHAQKLESLGVMAGGIAHDFNNLLMAMMASLELALLKLGPAEEARPKIEQALQSAWRAAELSGQMLAYSGQGLFVACDVNLSALVQANAHLLRAAISRTVQLDLRLGHDLPQVQADVAQFQQVVMSLVTNASEAIGEGSGVVTVTTGVGNFDREFLSRSVIEQKPEPGRYVWLEVADNGCGIDAETLQRMFDPFFSTKFTGRGLGLSAVMGIVKGHGGAITVESTVGRGSSIRVLLPLGERPTLLLQR